MSFAFRASHFSFRVQHFSFLVLRSVFHSCIPWMHTHPCHLDFSGWGQATLDYIYPQWLLFACNLFMKSVSSKIMLNAPLILVQALSMVRLISGTYCLSPELSTVVANYFYVYLTILRKFGCCEINVTFCLGIAQINPPLR